MDFLLNHHRRTLSFLLTVLNDMGGSETKNVPTPKAQRKRKCKTDCHALFLKIDILHFSIEQQLLLKMTSNKIHLTLNTEIFVSYPPLTLSFFQIIFLFCMTWRYFSFAWNLSTALLNWLLFWHELCQLQSTCSWTALCVLVVH